LHFDKKAMNFSNRLIFWYLKNKRKLPWRTTTEPYLIWLSEIILQQTRVEQGIPYYLRFTETYPSVFDLAAAKEEAVLKLWQGLGYYSRARNMHHTAKVLVKEREGEFPQTVKELKELKGIGDYTAAAIASLCYNQPVAVVDGNVYRVLSRVFGIRTPINSSAGIREFRSLAQELIDPDRPGEHNQAVMELGATLCSPRNPNCADCPLNDSCEALRGGVPTDFPVKLRKPKVRERYFNYLVLRTPDNKTLMKKRQTGIWTGLYEFPLLEDEGPMDEVALVRHENFPDEFKDAPLKITLFNPEPWVHKLSHQHLNTWFWKIETTCSDADLIPWKSVENYPVPRLIDKFLQANGNS
jgi:A/G-specific adenine glycosylase